MKRRVKKNLPKKVKITPWQEAADDCKILLNEADKLTARTSQISAILRDPRVHEHLNPDELKSLGDNGETALRLLSMFVHELGHHKASYTIVYNAGIKRKGADAFTAVLSELAQLMENYQTGILPVVVKVLSYGETVDERIATAETTVK